MANTIKDFNEGDKVHHLSRPDLSFIVHSKTETEVEVSWVDDKKTAFYEEFKPHLLGLEKDLPEHLRTM